MDTLLGRSWVKWVLSCVAGLSLALVITNVVLYSGNRTLQEEVNNRQQFINQSIQLDRLNRELIGALANLAARNQDYQLKNLLASQGISFTVSEPSGSVPAAGGGAPPAAGRTKPSRY